MHIPPTEFLIGIGTGCQQRFSKMFIFLLVILQIILINLCEILLQCNGSSVLICHFTCIILVYFYYSYFDYFVQETGKRRPIKLILPIVLSIGHRIHKTFWKSNNCIK